MSEKEQKQENEEPKVQEEKQEKMELELKQEELDDITDRYKRVLAEFENYKKRSSKERDSLYSSVLSDVVEAMLPVLDNLENAAKVETEDENYNFREALPNCISQNWKMIMLPFSYLV